MTCKRCGGNGDRAAAHGKYKRLICKACRAKDLRETRRKIREWVDGLKKNLKCLRCGFDDHRALHFHHRPNERKSFSIGDAKAKGRSKKSILAEMAKCDVLCANCHHIEHWGYS